jgi:hypothetical protein
MEEDNKKELDFEEFSYKETEIDSNIKKIIL